MSFMCDRCQESFEGNPASKEVMIYSCGDDEKDYVFSKMVVIMQCRKCAKDKEK